MNRGSAILPIRRNRCHARFNEAPIHESGKCDPREHASRPSSGFNEAPIHESGKSGRNSAGSIRRRDASMRPRFMNRGSEGCTIETSCGVRLSFNEAPIHESGKSRQTRWTPGKSRPLQ